MQINLNLAQISTFIAVAESGSFRAAADQLCISPPAVSARIQQLEQALGLQLLNRTTRSVSLTPEGKRLLETSTRTLSELVRLTSDLRSQAVLATGKVHLATLVSIASTILPSLLSQFSKEHPNLVVDFVDVVSDVALRSLTDGPSDLALTTRTLARRGLSFQPLYREACIPVVHRDHPLAALRSVDLRQIARYPVLAPPQGTEFRGILDTAFAAIGIQLEPHREAVATSTLAALVDAGHGIAFLTKPFLRQFNLPSSRQLRLKPKSVSRDVGIVTVENRALSPAAQAFRTFLVQQLSDPQSFHSV